ncbi:MAG: alpha-mannosidase, partial [Halothece sp.]
VEPEMNLISGESVIRQLLYGQTYIQEKFGKITEIAWLPDSFGFSWQLPQLLNHCGIHYFVTQKLHWNDTTEFPYGIFWWESPDGTKILSLMSPPNLTGVMDTNPITMTNYAVNWEQQTGLKDALWLPGVGDHGGGPTRSMLEVQECWRESPFFPNLEFTTATKFFKQLTDNQQSVSIPSWNNELYLEFHRGCYTTHADQKYFQRRCEKVLYEAELFASIIDILQFRIKTDRNYPKEALEKAWKRVLFNQFHDILPGTSIPEVFGTANEEWEAALQTGENIVKEALEAIASYITLPSPPHPNAKPIFVFNSLNWMRSQLVSIPLSLNHGKVYDTNGNKIPSQLSHNNTLLFFANDIPGVGYRLFWLYESNETNPIIPPLNKGELGGVNPHPKTFILENNYLLVEINPETGNLSRVFDKQNQREVLNGEGNQLQAFEDKGQYWDAWNIDPNYEKHPLPPAKLKSIQWRQKGELRSSIQIIRQIGNSEFCQDYILDIDSPILKIATTVNWQEESVLVKAAFPLHLEADFATYEIACGAIQRTTKPQTDAEKAKWEVYAHHWADLTDNSGNYGVSLLNDCKYGYDSQPNQLRLTLLRSPKWPDSQADKGHHTFTYALYPHSNTWQSAKTVLQGYSLNIPLRVLLSPSETPKNHSTFLPPVTQLLGLSAENLVLMALKQSEKDPGNWILRCYECNGESANFALQTDLEMSVQACVDGLEGFLSKEPEKLSIQPWKVTSFQIQA